jgi:selenium-binding protein 1
MDPIDEQRQGEDMPLLKPDPTFYPSPKMAMQAPPEKLAYMALINSKKDARPDAIGVVDLDPTSKGYGRLVGKVDMTKPGDELHHFGWNACSSCLCPYAPHPHMERRYLSYRASTARGFTFSTPSLTQRIQPS